MSLTRATRSEHAQSRKLAIPANSPAPHNECVHDWFAYSWHPSQYAPEFSRRNVQNLGLIRCHSGSRERRCPLQHRDIANEIAVVRNGELLFGPVALLEDLYFAAQYNSQTNIALSHFVHHLIALRDTTLAEWFKQRKLMIVQLGKRDAFGVAIKLLVIFCLVSHMQILRATQHNPNLSCVFPGKIARTPKDNR